MTKLLRPVVKSVKAKLPRSKTKSYKFRVVDFKGRTIARGEAGGPPKYLTAEQLGYKKGCRLKWE